MSHFGGTSNNAERRFRALISSSLNYQETTPKIRMFLRLLSILSHDSYELDGSDLNVYLESMRKLDDENKKEPGMIKLLLNFL